MALLVNEHVHDAGRALRDLGNALGVEVPPPDDVGVVEVGVPAENREAALQRVWDARAAAGADDALVFLEHPELPEHWRHRAGSPSPPVDPRRADAT